MSTLVNEVTLIGNVGANPTVYTFENGSKVATIKLATKDRKKNQDGEFENQAIWHTVKCTGKNAIFAEKFIHKGESLCIEGRLKHRSFITESGTKKTVSEINCIRFKILGGTKDRLPF